MTEVTQRSLQDAALEAWDAGMSIIPVRSDGTKKPPFPWKRYQADRADRDTVAAWFAPGQWEAAAVVCGKVSGGLVMIEMEGWAFKRGDWQDYRARCVDGLGEDRWAEITRHVELSPSGGVHIYVLVPGVDLPGHQKLAQEIVGDGPECIMETREEGGYSVIGASVGHATGNAWVTEQGSWNDLAVVTYDEYRFLLDSARAIDRLPKPDTEPAAADHPSRGWMDDTINDYNHRHPVLSMLPGWEVVGTDTYQGETVERLHRSGSDNDFGATIFSSGRVGFFSSNCPTYCQPYDGRSLPTYDSFSLALLEAGYHNETHERVEYAKRLRKQGYGPAWEDTPAAEAPAEVDPDEPPPFTPINWRAFWAGQTEEDWLVEPLFPKGRQVSIWASHKTGKSLLMLEMAAALATGAPCLAQAAAEPTSVIYLDMEMTEDDLRERLEDMGYGPESDLANLHYYLIPALAPLDTPEGGEQIMRLVAHHAATVVILDTMSRFTEGGENDADTYRMYYRHTGSRLKAAGISTARLDHGGKDAEKGQRGSSAKGDDIDLAWQLVPTPEGIAAKRNLSRMSWVPEYVPMNRKAAPLAHVIESRERLWPHGTQTVALEMERLGIAVDTPQREAMRIYRDSGALAGNDVMRAAWRWRRQQAKS